MTKTEAAIERLEVRIHHDFRNRKTMKPRGNKSTSKATFLFQAKEDRMDILADILALRALRASV